MKKSTSNKLTTNLDLKRETVRPITARSVTDDQLPLIVGGTSVIGPSRWSAAHCTE